MLGDQDLQDGWLQWDEHTGRVKVNPAMEVETFERQQLLVNVINIFDRPT